MKLDDFLSEFPDIEDEMDSDLKDMEVVIVDVGGEDRFFDVQSVEANYGDNQIKINVMEKE